MKKINPIKIYLLTAWHLIMPKMLRRKIIFATSGVENIAIGTTLTKIKYWHHFIVKRPMDKTIHFTYKE